MTSDCKIIENTLLKSDYMRIRFSAPDIVREAKPGQFVHVLIPNLRDRILRRPFSICGADPASGILTVVYKMVGAGTKELAKVLPGTICNIMGPQGNGFPLPAENELPVIVAGGYGAAATLPIAQMSSVKGILLLGARTQDDILLVDEYEKAGYDVRTATQDGSLGTKGLVTALLDGALADAGKRTPVLYACGPNGMLMALGKIANEKHIRAYLSIDHHMCCGIGACFACVVKVRDENPDGWRYSRSCTEGPVYDSTEVYYG